MLLCLGTTDKIQVVTSAAGDIDVHSSYADYDPAQAANDRVTLGRKNGNVVTAVTYDAVDPPGSGKSRNVKTLHVANAHASVANTVTLQHTDGTTVVEIEKVTLLPSERIAYREGIGTRVIDANGAEKTNPNAAVTYKKLAAQVSNSTVTAAKVTGLDFSCPVGVYIFEYFIIYRSSVVTTGIKLGVNHSGTVTQFNYWLNVVTANITGADAIADQDVLLTTGGLISAWAARAKSTNAPMITAGVDTITSDMLAVVQGICTVTADGNLELYHASETANATTLEVNSALRLTKIG